MSASRTRVFRPAFDRLESLCLLAAGLAPQSAIVHVLKTVDLKPTPVGTALLQAVAAAEGPVQATIDSLTATMKGHASATISGQLTVIDPAGPVTVVLKFTSPVEHPTAKHVKLKLGKAASKFTAAQKRDIQASIVGFVSAEHDQIVAALNAG